MTEVQKLQLDLLICLDDVCRKNNLVYYLAYGSCIGAVRNKGFIEWDHDIDVLMPYDHAMKLLLLQNSIGNNMFVSSYRTDINNKTIELMLVDKGHRCLVTDKNKSRRETYLSIDIYPLYNCPSNKVTLLLNIWRSHIYKILVGGVPQNHGKIMQILGRLILLFCPLRKRESAITKIEEHLNYKGRSDCVADYFGKDISLCNAITYKKEWFSTPSLLEFEGRMFYGPTDPDKYLTKRYGDYMTPLSPEERADEDKIELIS